MMALLLSLFILTLQTDVVVSSECNVDNCDPNHCNGFSCSKCLPGYYDSYNDNRYCRKCFHRCHLCNGDQCYSCYPSTCVNGTDICDFANCHTKGCSGPNVVRCSGCPDGFYLDGIYCYRCDNINCKCSSASGCDECLPGYYDTSTFCTKCVPGKYGHSCKLNCKKSCENGTCDQESGTCLTQCASEEYLDDAGRCQPCPNPRCAGCVNSTFCSSCKQSFHWGPICNYDCVGCNTSCNRNDGCSTGCSAPEYYNTYNPVKKGYECIQCPSQCETCLNETNCTSCKDNFWGQTCVYSCNHCDGTCDKNYGCTNNCGLGYYRHQIEKGHECKPCFSKCNHCLDSSTCKVCEDGYYVDDVRGVCVACSDNCKDNICDTSNGTCVVDSTTNQNVEDSDHTQQGLSNLDGNKSAIIGLAIGVGILCIVAVASIILNVFLWKSRKAILTTTNRSHEHERELIERSQARQPENVGYEDLTSVRPEERMYSSITHEYENANM